MLRVEMLKAEIPRAEMSPSSELGSAWWVPPLLPTLLSLSLSLPSHNYRSHPSPSAALALCPPRGNTGKLNCEEPEP